MLKKWILVALSSLPISTVAMAADEALLFDLSIFEVFFPDSRSLGDSRDSRFLLPDRSTSPTKGDRIWKQDAALSSSNGTLSIE